MATSLPFTCQCRALFKKCCWSILAEKFNTATLLLLPSIILFSIAFSKNIILPLYTFDNSTSLCSILQHCPSIYYFDASPKSYLEYSPVPSLIASLNQSHQIQLCDIIQLPTETLFESTLHNYQTQSLISSDHPTSYFIKFVYDNLDHSLHFTVVTRGRNNDDGDATEALGSFVLYSSIVSQVPLLNKQGPPATVAIEDESNILRSDGAIKIIVLFQILSALLPFYVITCKAAIREKRKGMGVLLRREGLSIFLSLFFELSRFLLMAFLSVSFFLLTMLILKSRLAFIFHRSPSELFMPILMHIVILITRGFLGAELFKGSFAVVISSFIMLSEGSAYYTNSKLENANVILSLSYISQFVYSEQKVNFKLKELMAVAVTNIVLTLILQHRWKVFQWLKYRWYCRRSKKQQKFINSFDIELKNILLRNKEKTNINLDLFQASKGEVVAFYGNDINEGTALLQLITGKKSPQYGFVHIFGKDPFKESWKVRGLFSYCSRDHYFWPNLTVLQHIQLLQILYNKDNNVTDMLISTGLVDVQNNPLKHLTHSMRSRLNIVLSDIKSHPLIIMEQPTEGLDLNEKLKFLDYIHMLKNSALLLVMTNNSTEAYSLGDRILFLHKGEVAFEGTQCSLPPMRDWNTLTTETQCQYVPSSALISTKEKILVILKSSLNNILAHFKLFLVNKKATLCLFLLPFLLAFVTSFQRGSIDKQESNIFIHNDTALRFNMKMSLPDDEKIDVSLFNVIESLSKQDNSFKADPFYCNFEFYHLQKDCIKLNMNVTGEMHYRKTKDKCLRWILGQFAVLGISSLPDGWNDSAIIKKIEGVFGEEQGSHFFNYRNFPKTCGNPLILVCSFLGGCFFLFDRSPKLEKKATRKVTLVGFWIGTAVFHMMILEVLVGILLGMSPLWPFLADGKQRLLALCLFVTGIFINGLSYLYASFMRSDANFITYFVLLINLFNENMRKNENPSNPLVLYNQMIISSVSGMTSFNHTWIPMVLLLLYGFFLIIIASLIDIYKGSFIQILKENLKWVCRKLS